MADSGNSSRSRTRGRARYRAGEGPTGAGGRAAVQ